MTLLIPHNKHMGLLSEAEAACFDIARKYQRKAILAGVIDLERLFWPANVARLTWSEGSFRFLVQCAILVVYLPLNTFFQLLKSLHSLVMLPFRLAATLFTPSGLHAPGEKNLVGLYNAFFPYLELKPEDAVACLDDWVPVLYGGAKAQQYKLARYADDERLKQLRAAEQSGVMAASFRSFRAIARERLSKDLGHYTGNRCD